MDYNNNKLRGKIKEVFGSESSFCDKMNISRSTLSDKLNNKSDFTRKEMIKIVNLLDIKKDEVFDLFFLKF